MDHSSTNTDKQEKKELNLLHANVRDLVSTRKGKEVLWEILGYCSVYSSIPGKFEAGRRQVGLDIIQLLEDSDPTIYPNLLLEKANNG